MMSTNHHAKKAVCSIWVAVVLWPLAAHATALLPDPDNAALLYYQALLLRPEPDDATDTQMRRVLWGAEPDEKVRRHVWLCSETIEIAEAAAQIPKCDWGIRYSKGFRAPLPQVQHVGSLTSLLEASAAVLSADGDYQTALARCLTIRKLAGHIGDDTVHLYAVSVGVDQRSLRAIRHVLGRMPPDADAFGWLESQVATVRGTAESPARALQMDLALALQTMGADPNILAWVRKQLVESAKDNSAKNAIRSLTDEELVARAREPYAKFLGSALGAMDSDMPYEQNHAEIQRMIKQLKDKFGSDPAASQVIMACSEQVVKFYGLHIRHRTHFNAVTAAIEIYLTTAKTGRLPETLPDGLPKDPYSGQDFEYETTGDGFVLRCRVRDIDERKVQEYEFKVRKSG